MKRLKYLLLLCALGAFTFIGINEAVAKKRQLSHIYMFGFSASFNDSIIYFTDIQTVDSAWIDDKSLFLQGREIYSQQLKDYFAASMQPNRICVVIYAPTLKEAEKKYLKLKRQYTVKHAGHYDVRYLNENEFHFTSVNMAPDDEPAPQVKEKKDKKSKKKGRSYKRDGKRPPRDGKMPSRQRN